MGDTLVNTLWLQEMETNLSVFKAHVEHLLLSVVG